MTECMQLAGHDVEEMGIRYCGRITSLKKVGYYAAFWWKCLTKNFRKYDLIYINHAPFCAPAFFNPTRRAAKTIVHWHGDDVAGNRSVVKVINSLLRGRLKRSRQLVPSEYFRGLLAAKMNFAPEQIAVTPSGGVDTEAFAVRKSAPEDLVVGYPAELTDGKGADVLLYIVRRRAELENALGRQVKFSCISYGRQADYYSEALAATGADCRVWKKMPRSHMPGFYRSLSVCLMPTQRESLGLVALEAMSCGVPVVAFDRNAAPEFVISGISGEIAPYHDNLEIRADAMLKALIKVASNLENYAPEKIVIERYSRQSVAEFYRGLKV